MARSARCDVRWGAFASNKCGGTVHGLLADGCDHVGVHVCGDRNRGVAEELGHDRDIGFARKHQTGGRVSQAVECQLRQRLALLADYLEQPRDVRRIVRPAS